MTQLKQIGPEWAERVYALCARQPDRCLYHAGWVHEGGLEQSLAVPRGWMLAELDDDGQLRGVAYLSSTGILLPALATTAGVDALVTIGKSNPGMFRVIVGERALVESLWERLERIGFSARLVRDQLVYSVTRARFTPVEDGLPLEVAGDAILDELVDSSAAMAREEAHDDPQSRNPSLFRERIKARLARGRDFVYRKDSHLVFKANVSALSPLGGQLEGIYTLPAQRGLRFGKRGTSAVTSWVLERAARAVLLVNRDNEIAKRLYESLSYARTSESRTIFVAP